MKWIYKITYPNNKIYIGSPNSEILEKDFTEQEKIVFTVTREILWKSENASDEDVNKKEVELINKFQSNNPALGYNRWPKFKS